MDLMRSDRCACPKIECPRNGNCRECVKNHRSTDSMPHCLFMDNGGDKTLKNFYIKLKERFENQKA